MNEAYVHAMVALFQNGWPIFSRRRKLTMCDSVYTDEFTRRIIIFPSYSRKCVSFSQLFVISMETKVTCVPGNCMGSHSWTMYAIGQGHHHSILVEETETNHSTRNKQKNMLWVRASTILVFGCMAKGLHVCMSNECLHASTSSSTRASITFEAHASAFSIHPKYA